MLYLPGPMPAADLNAWFRPDAKRYTTTYSRLTTFLTYDLGRKTRLYLPSNNSTSSPRNKTQTGRPRTSSPKASSDLSAKPLKAAARTDPLAFPRQGPMRSGCLSEIWTNMRRSNGRTFCFTWWAQLWVWRARRCWARTLVKGQSLCSRLENL
jgi:hypothetical protein